VSDEATPADRFDAASLGGSSEAMAGVTAHVAEVGTPDVPTADHGLHRRNDRILLGTIAAYVGFLSILMILKGVSITPDVMLVALGLAAVVLGRGRLFIRDWVPFIGLFLAYELMRGYADDLGGAIHSADVLGLERALFGGALPTEVLQRALHPAAGVDPWAIGATVFYFLHFPLPLAVGFLLWVRHRRTYYDFVAALILVSMAGFATYLVLPVAPPWWAADHGLIPGPSGAPAITYLKQQAFDDLGRMLGFAGNYLYTYTIYDINPNQVAAFPSLHAGYPFLAFLFARRAFGKAGWLMLVYAACVWFSVVYLADHYVVDILAGLAYAFVAYAAVVHAPGWFRRVVDRAADPSIEAEVEAGEATSGWRARWRLAERISWPALATGLAIAAAGVVGLVLVDRAGWLGGRSSPGLLIPWALVIAGLWRSALAVLAR
jgi:hypothetical protein